MKVGSFTLRLHIRSIRSAASRRLIIETDSVSVDGATRCETSDVDANACSKIATFSTIDSCSIPLIGVVDILERTANIKRNHV